MDYSKELEFGQKVFDNYNNGDSVSQIETATPIEDTSNTAYTNLLNYDYNQAVGTFWENLFNPSATSQYINAYNTQKQREWEELMSNTAYQRQVEDMKKAGLNPYALYSNSQTGGASTPTLSVPSATKSSFLVNAVGSALKLLGVLLSG